MPCYLLIDLRRRSQVAAAVAAAAAAAAVRYSRAKPRGRSQLPEIFSNLGCATASSGQPRALPGDYMPAVVSCHVFLAPFWLRAFDNGIASFPAMHSWRYA
jgi:hypothetical protein